MTDYSKFNDHELAAFLKEGDWLAFTHVYNYYKATLYLQAFRVLKDENEARDIVQDVFTSIWEKRESFLLRTSLASYLCTVVRNRVLNIIAHQKITSSYAESIQSFLDKGEFITDNIIREKELNYIIEKEIALLPEKMREVFLLSRNTDLSHKEIGKKSNISDKTVKKQVVNAVRILRLKLNLTAWVLFFHFF